MSKLRWRLPLFGMLFATATATSTAAATAENEAPPEDAPAACVAPVGATGLAPALAAGPELIGTYQLVAGKALTTKRFRLLATAHFIPERVGSARGEWLPGLEVTLLPDAIRDGESYRNSVSQHGYDPLRIGTYRVTVRKVTTRAKQTILETVVEDLGCKEDYTHAPLAPGASRTVWLSSEGTRGYAFSTGHWYDQVPRFEIHLSAELAPLVQQEPDTKTPHGHISLRSLESLQVMRPSLDDRGLPHIQAGKVIDLASHTIEIVDVVLGANTQPVDGSARVTTTGAQPVAHVLLRITARTKPLDKAVFRQNGIEYDMP